ncbi:DUF3343 domain-containing protein [Acidaminobacterium chupaoyuni]
MGCMIVFKSVTYAQRANFLLSKQGIPTVMVRAQAILGSGSCSYGIKCKAKQLEQVVQLLKKNKIPFGKIYVMNQVGVWQEAELSF